MAATCLFWCSAALLVFIQHAWRLERSQTVIVVLQARILLLGLLIPFASVKAKCLQGKWFNGTWSAACDLPKDPFTHCLARKDILLIGDSTTRHFIFMLSEKWEVELKRHPCNLSLGHGCFDCEMGCHNKLLYGADGGRDWEDLSLVSPAGYTVWFSWKAELFSVDDIMFLQHLKRSRARFDVVFVHKGTHAAFHWDSWQHSGMPKGLFLEESRVRATLYARMLAAQFPKARLIYRDIYHNHIDAGKNAIHDMVRAAITPVFNQQGFVLLPGHDVMAAAPKELSHEDGIHPKEPVIEALMLMMASIFCPPRAAQEVPKITAS